MAIEIPTNTALYIPVGPFLDKTDGISPELSITVANSAITLIAGAADETAPTVVLDSVAGNNGTNTLVHITDDDAGMYYLKLTAANNNRYGKGTLIIEDTDTYVTVFHEIQWVSVPYYNWKYGTTLPNVNVTQISGDSDAADNLELAYDGTGYAGGTTKQKVDLETVKTKAITCADAITILASVGTAATSTAQTGDSYAIVNHADYGNAHLVRSTTPANTLSVDANHLVAVPSTQDVNAKTVTNGAISNATFNADVGSTAYATNIIALAVRKVLDELKLDHLIAVAESDDPVDNSIIAKLAATGGDWSTFAGSTDSLQGIRDRGDAAWVTATGFAVAGDEMKLEDDAITAAKFDESTAFPLKAADTGATILARAGDEMDLVDAPNETAVTAIQNGLSTFDSTSDGVTLTTGGIDAIFDRNSSLSISFETLINRIYQMLNDKMEVTNESGDVVLRNIADSADIATGNVTDNSTTTVRKGLTWV